MDSDDGQKVAGNTIDKNVPQPAETSTSGEEASLAALAGMFQTFLQYQRERDERQDKEISRREQQVKVLTHQVTQLQMDFEHTRQRIVNNTPISGFSVGFGCTVAKISRGWWYWELPDYVWKTGSSL